MTLRSTLAAASIALVVAACSPEVPVQEATTVEPAPAYTPHVVDYDSALVANNIDPARFAEIQAHPRIHTQGQALAYALLDKPLALLDQYPEHFTYSQMRAAITEGIEPSFYTDCSQEQANNADDIRDLGMACTEHTAWTSAVPEHLHGSTMHWATQLIRGGLSPKYAAGMLQVYQDHDIPAWQPEIVSLHREGISVEQVRWSLEATELAERIRDNPLTRNR